MLTAAAYIKILVALIVVVNPFGIIPVFDAMTARQSVIDHKRIACIAVPVLAAPGAISTTIICASENKSVLHVVAIVGCGLAVGVITWIALRVATRVGRYMSRTSISVATHLMGLLLAELAVEIFAGGAHEL